MNKRREMVKELLTELAGALDMKLVKKQRVQEFERIMSKEDVERYSKMDLNRLKIEIENVTSQMNEQLNKEAKIIDSITEELELARPDHLLSVFNGKSVSRGKIKVRSKKMIELTNLKNFLRGLTKRAAELEIIRSAVKKGNLNPGEVEDLRYEIGPNGNDVFIYIADEKKSKKKEELEEPKEFETKESK